MHRLHVGATGTLAPALRHDLRQLLDAAFDGAFTDDDWTHACGGWHAWVAAPSGPISHGALVPRTLSVGGRQLLTGYVEGVATAAAHRRAGHGSAVMHRLGSLIAGHYVLGALSTGAVSFYERLGWERWRGPTFVDGPSGVQRTPDDDGGIMILRTPRTPPLDLDAAIVCDWRAGDVW